MVATCVAWTGAAISPGQPLTMDRKRPSGSGASRPLSFVGGAFERVYRKKIGPPLDLSGLMPGTIPLTLLERARSTWRERALSEFRSIQIMIRFLTEVVGAGDPLDVYAGAVELVEDEIRHTQMCAAICAALGAPASLPEPVALADPPGFLAAPMPERALATAITMLGINETISAGYIADLAARCRNVHVKQVLDATIGDEDEHSELGWTYIADSLRRFLPSTMDDWRHLVRVTLQPHQTFAERSLVHVPPFRQRPEAWNEPELADLGLFSPERQALVFRKTCRETLEPRLSRLDLLPGR
jgi:hypothetical protein